MVIPTQINKTKYNLLSVNYGGKRKEYLFLFYISNKLLIFYFYKRRFIESYLITQKYYLYISNSQIQMKKVQLYISKRNLRFLNRQTINLYQFWNGIFYILIRMIFISYTVHIKQKISISEYVKSQRWFFLLVGTGLITKVKLFLSWLVLSSRTIDYFLNIGGQHRGEVAAVYRYVWGGQEEDECLCLRHPPASTLHALSRDSSISCFSTFR